MEYSKVEITFLDTVTYVQNGILKTQLYHKPTDSHSYLDYDSCHPIHNKTSIPYSQFLRIRRNCTDWTMFMKHSIHLYSYLSMRGYPHELIIPALLKANRISQQEALCESSTNKNTDNLYCIVDYNPTNPPIKEWIKQLWPILEHSSGTRTLTDINIIYGYRKPPSLQDILVKSDITQVTKFKSLAPRCNRFPKCRHCPKIIKTGKVKSFSTGRHYKIPNKVSCTSSDVIYMLECQLCGKQYVGQTKNKLLQRVNQHYSTIRTKADTPISRHFNDHQINENFPINIYVLQYIRAKNQSDLCELRNKWEMYWIARLHTVAPHGLNIMD